MAVQLDEGHSIFLGPGDGESIPGAHRTLIAKAERAEFEITEFECTPEFGPVGTGFFEGVRERYRTQED